MNFFLELFLFLKKDATKVQGSQVIEEKESKG